MLNKRSTIFIVGLITLWRAYLCATLQLHHDEAYYWLWTKHLALSYFDHPPMVGYFIWFTTLLSGAEFWVRFSGIIVSIVLSILLWKLAKNIFNDDEIAGGSVVLLNVLPVTMAGGIIITPDTPAFLFWGFSVYFVWKAFQQQKPVYWYVTGIFFGLSMISKYTTVLFGMCLFLYMVFTEDRKWFKTIHPYLACLIALVIFLPVVFWNWQHEWVSFKFQLGHGIGKKPYSLMNLGEYIGGQLLVVSPFVWIAGLWAASVFLFSRNKGKIFLVMMSIPILLFFGWASLKKPGEANWPALCYFTFVLIAGAYFLGASKAKKIFYYCLILTSAALSFTATLHSRFSVIPLAKINKELAVADATNFFYGWKELGQELNRYSDAKFVLTHSHQLSAAIEYYTDGRLKVFIVPGHTRFSQYDLWKFPEEFFGSDGLFVFDEDLPVEPFRAYFKSSGDIKTLTINRKGFPIRTYRILSGKSLNRFEY